MSIFKQSGKHILPLGGVLVQIQNSMFYLNLISTGMMLLTFWYTAGYQIQQEYMNWLTIYWFALIIVAIFLIVMLVDFNFILPSRQAFLNEQSCKHENPAMEAIWDIQKNLKIIEAKVDKISIPDDKGES